MKKISSFSIADEFIFEETTNIKIKIWVSNNLNKFNLEEESSCSVELQNEFIIIQGDEDYLGLEITKFNAIKL